MPGFNHRKPLSPSTTVSPHKKTTSSQREKHLPDKPPSKNFSSSLKPKRAQHSQDGECYASSTSCSYCDAREIGNFKHGLRKGQKMSIISQGTKPSGHSVIHFDKRFPQSFPQRQIKNRQQLYVTMESEKNKLGTDEDSHHDDPDCMTYRNWYKVLWRECKKQAKRIVISEADADSLSDESMSFDTRTKRMPSDSRNKLYKHFVPNENLAFPSSEGVEVKIESWDRVKYRKIVPSVQTCMIRDSDCVYKNPQTPAVSSHVSTPNQINILFNEKKRILINRTESIHPKKRGSEEKDNTLVHKEENVVEEEELSTYEERNEDFEALIKVAHNIHISKDNLDLHNFLVGHKTTIDEAVKKTLKYSLYVPSLLVGHETTIDEAVNKILQNRGIEEEGDTPGDKEEIVVKEEEVKNEAVSKRYKHESTFIKLYRNIIRNETCRMMTGIDLVVSEAKHLFGIETTRIFFDLLVDGLFHFESARAISTFVPNMAESSVRLDVTSFFEHSSDIVNRIMALLLGCPDSKRLQQMPEQLFLTLLQSVIVSFLSNNKTKRGKSLSHKGTKRIRLIMVAPRLFVIAVGEEIPEDVLVGLRNGDELIMNSFVDARLERMQASEIQDKRPIHSLYLPNDGKLFIYIPTENGSYWHKMDMMRDNRIRRHGK